MGFTKKIKDGLKHAVQECFDGSAGYAAAGLGAAMHGGSRDTFAHPGTLMGPREVELLRSRTAGNNVNDEWAAAAAQLAQDTPKQYSPHALKEAVIDFNGVGKGHDELVEKDGKMVYMQTMMWLVSGDDKYARNAADIIWAWSTTNRVFKGQNAPLEAGWGVASMARSAELLKHTWPGWNSVVEAAFLSWVDRLIMPELRSEALSRLPLGNWHSTIAECKGQLAILKGDRRLLDEALSDWRRVMDAYLQPCGECTETKRDLYHSQFGLGGLIQLAEVAWQQGLDLYSYGDSKLCRAMEFHAAITNGKQPRECCYPLKGIGFLPCGWEVGWNHYAGRWGVSMPETEAMLRAKRPERYVFHWGLGTLSHYGSAQALAAAGGGDDGNSQQR